MRQTKLDVDMIQQEKGKAKWAKSKKLIFQDWHVDVDLHLLMAFNFNLENKSGQSYHINWNIFQLSVEISTVQHPSIEFF